MTMVTSVSAANDTTARIFGRFVASVFGLCLMAGAVQAQDLVPFRVNGFPNAKALPLHAGIAKGIFAKRGMKIELQLTDSSKAQRDGLAAGAFEIAHSALDNAIAMIEVAKQDVPIVSGRESGMT